MSLFTIVGGTVTVWKMDTTDLSGTSYAVLGILEKQPRSGYDLSAFADRTVAHFWPISRTLVYRELARLERLGLATGTPVAQERLPDKRVYTITAEGRAAFDGWLARPTFEEARFRSGFLLKLFFGLRVPAERVTQLLEDYRHSLQEEASSLRVISDRLAGDTAKRFGRLTALYGVRSAEARLAWLDEVEAELHVRSASAKREETT
ncbi:MAG TPA: PadR family transcriptional regulator [Candidatus Limnocylindrales bacterium]|nr:PadR family transcriptional regulator [Candidatus Limnocylindrales bacterium]